MHLVNTKLVYKSAQTDQNLHLSTFRYSRIHCIRLQGHFSPDANTVFAGPAQQCFHETIPYFSAYKTESFPFQNNPKNLDLSYKSDLDL